MQSKHDWFVGLWLMIRTRATQGMYVAIFVSNIFSPSLLFGEYLHQVGYQIKVLV